MEPTQCEHLRIHQSSLEYKVAIFACCTAYLKIILFFNISMYNIIIIASDHVVIAQNDYDKINRS